MERIVIINESTFTKWMERVKELLSVLHCQEQQVKNKGIGTWLDTSEVCAMLNLGFRDSRRFGAWHRYEHPKIPESLEKLSRCLPLHYPVDHALGASLALEAEPRIVEHLAQA